jgi:F0F1-type ATP synthase assembly protein I
MSYLILFTTGLLIGFVAGLLVFRNNAAKLKASEDKGKHLIDALKGK